MSAELKEFQAEQRQMLEQLDKSVDEADKARRKRADEFADWAMRRGKPNPKFDEDWSI